jgi:hypothetical protein
LHPRYRFDSFIEGACNELAASAARADDDEPGTHFNPLFIYGGVGLGKTHLLHGVGHELYRKSEPANEFDQFRARYRRDCDCLLIEDVEWVRSPVEVEPCASTHAVYAPDFVKFDRGHGVLEFSHSNFTADLRLNKPAEPIVLEAVISGPYTGDIEAI